MIVHKSQTFLPGFETTRTAKAERPGPGPLSFRGPGSFKSRKERLGLMHNHAYFPPLSVSNPGRNVWDAYFEGVER